MTAKPLSYVERIELSLKVRRLRSHQLARVIHIVSSMDSSYKDFTSDEIVIDFDILKPATLRRLERYVESCLDKEPYSNDTPPQPSQVIPANKVLQDYRELFLKQENCDVIIKVQGQEFGAHQIILAARSPIFGYYFQNNMQGTDTVIVADCDPSTFPDFLCFLYCGDTEITAEKVYSLFATAEEYNVSDLREKCLAFVKENLSLDTFYDTVMMALKHSVNELVVLVIDFFSKNALEIIQTEKWQSYVVNEPTYSNYLLVKALEHVKNVM